MRKLILAFLLCLAFSVAASAQVTFYYVVTTVDTIGLESAYSTQATATLTQGKSKVTLTWTAPTVPTGGNPIAGYRVYRGTASGGPYTLITPTLVTGGTSFTDPFVVPNAPTNLVPAVS